MSDIAIRVEGLGKQYSIGAPERYRTLRDALTDALTAPFRRLRNGHASRAESETIWALKNVTFEVKYGEVIGIIGRNGAGKSTLLKILSRIMEPTEGHAEIHGRVASLLEVGTGFHPELTGRENIFLNGAILGMKRAEILRKFDEIVAFAEVDKFIDTPVKRYSSGMHVRLAFAVAAHLEQEILVVDEVLAVGDADFQRKCLGKMQDVSQTGRTVLFVSHNMAVIQALCPTTMLLDGGGLRFKGDSMEAAATYLKSDHSITVLERAAKPDGTLTITHLELTHVECCAETEVRFRIQIQGREFRRCSIEAKFCDSLGTPVGHASLGLLDPEGALEFGEASHQFSCRAKLPKMARGIYRLSVQVAIPFVTILDSTGEGITFEVHPKLLPGFTRVLESQWGNGAFEFPLEIEWDPMVFTAAGHCVASQNRAS